jgi:hypothetical protein
MVDEKQKSLSGMDREAGNPGREREKLLRWGFHLLSARCGERRYGRATWLAIPEVSGWLTVAGQHRTCTGFAFEPFYPGIKAPNWHVFD